MRKEGNTIDRRNTIERQSSKKSQVLKLRIQLVYRIYDFKVHKCIPFLVVHVETKKSLKKNN